MIGWTHLCHDQLNTSLAWSSEEHLPTHSWWEVDGLQPSAVEYNNSFGLVVVLHVIAEEKRCSLYTSIHIFSTTDINLAIVSGRISMEFSLPHNLHLITALASPLPPYKKAVTNILGQWWNDLDWHPFLLTNILPVVRHFSAAVTLQFQVPPDGMCWS